MALLLLHYTQLYITLVNYSKSYFQLQAGKGHQKKVQVKKNQTGRI